MAIDRKVPRRYKPPRQYFKSQPDNASRTYGRVRFFREYIAQVASNSPELASAVPAMKAAVSSLDAALLNLKQVALVQQRGAVTRLANRGVTVGPASAADAPF